jgi:hypothetical protein
MGSSGPDLGIGLLGGGSLFDGAADDGVGLLGGGEAFAPPRFGMGDILAGNGGVAPSPYGNDPWSAWAAWLGIPPDALRRLDAALAASPGYVPDRNGPWQSDQRATGDDFIDRPGERGPVDVAKQFEPRNPGGFADVTSPFNRASYAGAVSAMEGRETGPSDLVRMLTGFGQGGVSTNSWSGPQAGAQPQWWRAESAPAGVFEPPLRLTNMPESERKNPRPGRVPGEGGGGGGSPGGKGQPGNQQQQEQSSPRPPALGDLTVDEVRQIQAIVNQAGRPLEVVGSAARGMRKPGSDIDYLVPPGSLPYFEGVAKGLPGLNPKHGIVPAVGNPDLGPDIRFEPQ